MNENQANPAGNPEDPKHLRLTLRTLLAYLDDVLEPAQAREIGAKIQETQFASQLVDRIQDVLRRRRVSAPDLAGPGSGLDPNTVAEYLDNTLAPTAVPDVERVCLESDSHLAEVAGCHQILTLVLGDPIHVSAESRERLHALIPTALMHKTTKTSHPDGPTEPVLPRQPAKPPVVQTPAEELAESKAAAREAIAAISNGDGRKPARPRAAFAESIPDYLKPKPLWKRALVPTLVVLVFMLWLGLLIYDPSLLDSGSSNSEEVAQNENVPEEANPSPPAKTEQQKTEAAASQPVAKTEANTPEEKQEVAEVPQPNPQATDPETSEEPKQPQTEPPVVASKNPMPMQTEVAVVPEKVEPTVNQNPPQPPPANPPTQTVGEVSVVYDVKNANLSPKGMLFRHDPKKDVWTTIPYNYSVDANAKLACPEPLSALFSLRNSESTAELIGGALFSFHPAKDPAVLLLNLDMGKVIFTRPDEGDEAETVSVKVGDDTYQLELTAPGTRCGLEILPKFPTQFEQSLGANWYTGKLWVATGSVKISDAAGNNYTLLAQQSLDITPQKPPGNQPSPTSATVEINQLMPEWMAVDRKVGNLRQISQVFEVQASDIIDFLLPAAKANRGMGPEAAKALVMTGCLNETADLLSRDEGTPSEIREAAIEATRRWLTLHPGPKETQAFRSALKKHLFLDTPDKIYQLLWGYSPADLQDKAKMLRLVEFLDDDHITVRTLAFTHLKELTGITNNYDPLHDKAKRRSSVNRWYDEVRSGKFGN